MSKFLCKIIGHRTSYLGVLRNPSVCSLRWITSSDLDHEHSFTVSYLIESIGLSPEHALSASKSVAFKTREKPDKFIRVLEDYGFNKTQISALVRTRPELIVSNLEKTILPKLEFLRAKGISGPEIAKMLSSFPSIFHSSLDKTIIPSYDFLRNLFNSDEMVIGAVKRYPNILGFNLKHLGLNIETLREHGVPDSNIVKLIRKQGRSFALRPEQYRKVVERVAEMGFNAFEYRFVLAVHVFLATSESTRQSKVDVFKKWGLSEEEVLSAFRRNPWVLSVSESKFTACMDYLVKEMGYMPSVIMQCSTVLSLSLKKRVIPRCSIFQVLVSKGLVKNKVNLNTLLLIGEDKFIKKYVAPHQKEAPELLELLGEKSSSL